MMTDDFVLFLIENSHTSFNKSNNYNFLFSLIFKFPTFDRIIWVFNNFGKKLLFNRIY